MLSFEYVVNIINYIRILNRMSIVLPMQIIIFTCVTKEKINILLQLETAIQYLRLAEKNMIFFNLLTDQYFFKKNL